MPVCVSWIMLWLVEHFPAVAPFLISARKKAEVAAIADLRTPPLLR
jgi:hypothetical protein